MSDERAEFEERTAEAQARLRHLEARIRAVAPVQSYASPADIGPAVETALGALLEARFREEETPDAFTETHRLHAAYARDRLQGPYVGGGPYLDRLDRWMAEPGAPPLLITGASGGGKSALIAHWLQAWRKKRPDDILFAHYLGASPDSADPTLLMRRLCEHLNRATGEAVDLPGGQVELMDLAAGLARRLAQAALNAERRGLNVVIALDGLDKLSGEPNLRWLPSVLRGNVKLVASGLDGEAKDAGLARGWDTLAIAPLDDAGRRDLIADTLALWGKRPLPSSRETRILGHSLAGLPLFLKTVLDELRVGATEAVLDARLGDYLQATDMPALFARMLARLERDDGAGLVTRALSLVWASRAGLEEGEIIAVTGATQFAWAKLRNGLGDNLRDQAGRVAFSHDFLRSAVETRYLPTGDARRAVRLALADRFDGRAPDARQAEELPYQLRAAEAWERLEKLLVDLDRFELLRKRGDGELLGWWLPLAERGRDVEGLLCGAFDARAGAPARWARPEISLGISIQAFLRFAGATGEAPRRLGERLVSASQRVYSREHPETLAAIDALASILHHGGDLDGAQKFREGLLEAMMRWHGPGHLQTLAPMNNLAHTLHARGDLEGAQNLQGHVAEAMERWFGPEHPDTLTSAGNLAETLRENGDPGRARTIWERVREARVRLLGPDHPLTLESMNNLALTLHACGDLDGARKLWERTLAVSTRILGPEHRDTLMTMSGVAENRRARGDLDGAQELGERVLEARTRRLGPEHPDTLISMNNLAATLRERSDLDGAQKLLQRMIEASTRRLGPEHPATLSGVINLATTLYARGNLGGAKKLLERVPEAAARRLGREHPTLLTAMSNLATTLCARGDLDDGQKLQERVLEACMRRPGPEHPTTLMATSSLATTLYQRGDLDGAQKLLERVLDVRTRRLGEDDPDTLASAGDLTETLRENGDLHGAQKLQERVLDVRTRLLGPEHPDTLASMNDLAQIHYARGDLVSAQNLQARVLMMRLPGPEK